MPEDLRHSTKSFSKRAADRIIAQRKLFTLLSVVISLLLATGIIRTSFNTSLDALLTESDPYLDELFAMNEAFPSPTEVRFAFVANEPDTVFNAELLAALEDLKNNYRSIPFTDRLTTLLDYVSPETQRKLFIQTLRSYSEEDLAEVEAAALADRLLTANLLSDDAALTFAILTTESDGVSADDRLEIANAALQLRDELRLRHPNVQILANSDVILEQSSQQAMVDDLTSLMPFVILACVLAICYCFRSATLGICILTHVIFTLLCTVGTLGYLGFSFNSISIIAPLVLVIVAVANSVHIISIYKQAMHRGIEKIEAMRESVAHNFQPVSLAALTTAIGFSSLNMCSSPAIQEFGQIVAIGIVFAYLLTLLLLPAVLIWMTSKREVIASTGVSFMEGTLERISEITRVRDIPIFWGCTFLAIATFALLPLNETDFNRIDFIAADSDIKQYYDEVSTHYNRGPALNYGIDLGVEWSAIEPDFLRRIEEFGFWLNEQEEVESSASVADVVKTIHRVQNDHDEAFNIIPDDFDTVANYLLAYALIQSDDFPLFGFVSTDFAMINLFINAVPMSNQDMIDFDARVTEKLEQDFPEAELLHGSGILLFARMDELVTVELLQGYSISLVLITISLIIGMRSVYFGLLSIIPNLLPATMVFGFWALFVGQLDPFVMMLFSISIGLVVDDTVHLLSHYLEKRRAGFEKTNSIDYAIKTAGPALSITTIVLALGTTILIAANTIYFQQAAKLLVPIVVLALVLDLFYLPTILRRFDNKFKTPAPTPA
ncbi:MAG: RND transporter [Pseudohongiella sp.]|nr:MAG: RND transporter [Pseudohongiella sp.]